MSGGSPEGMTNPEATLAHYQAQAGMAQLLREKDLEIERWKSLAERLQAQADEMRSGWRPIGTAPKDAVILLGYEPHWRLEGSRRVYEGRWNEDQQTWTSVNGFLVFQSATHWMPLPAAPTPTNRDGQHE